MTPLDLVPHVGRALMIFCLVGLFLRRRHHLCQFFPVHLVAVLIPSILISTWPASFYNWSFWIVKENLADILTFVVALELVSKVFQAFPRARRVARCTILVILLVTFGLLLAPAQGPPVLDLHPRLLAGTVWILIGIAALVMWYRIPLHPFHRALLLGFVFSLGVASGSLVLASKMSWEEWRPTLGWLGPIAYDITLVGWTWAAWRRERVPLVAPAVLQRLQPWRVTS